MKFDPTKLISFQRPNYFQGKLLTADDLRAEQDYHLQQRWLHNRMLHGYGIVAGLEVLIEESETSGAEIIVSPGMALDGWGREIIVPDTLRAKLPSDRRELLVYVKYIEQLESATAPYIFETAELFLEPPHGERVITPATRADYAIAIARLRRPHLTWQRDRAFRPPRPR
ncbi:MAG TPA: hypothetical protein VFD70_07365 [Anaerolineae bacterium]|nr:hypothetical protein [Anaerolineae bacterium]